MEDTIPDESDEALDKAMAEYAEEEHREYLALCRKQDQEEAQYRNYALRTGHDVLRAEFAYVWVRHAVNNGYFGVPTITPVYVRKGWDRKEVHPDYADRGVHWVEDEDCNMWIGNPIIREMIRPWMDGEKLAPGHLVLYRFERPHWYRSSWECDEWDATYYFREIYRQTVSPRATRWRWTEFERLCKRHSRILEARKRNHLRHIVKRPQDLYVRLSYRCAGGIMTPVTERTAYLYSSTPFPGHKTSCWGGEVLAEVTLKGNSDLLELRTELGKVTHAKFPELTVEHVVMAPARY